MVSEQPTRKVVQLLLEQGWVRVRTVGSHSVWQAPNGSQFTLPDGHRRISPGVYRNLLKAIEEAKK